MDGSLRPVRSVELKFKLTRARNKRNYVVRRDIKQRKYAEGVSAG